MNITAEMVQKVKAVADEALQKIGADSIQEKVDLAVKFARSQAPMKIVLDGGSLVTVAVDIATVFSQEGSYRQIEYKGATVTAEAIQALSIVLVGDNVKLCKSTYDVVPGSTFQDAQFINARYWITTLDALTEKYIC